MITVWRIHCTTIGIGDNIMWIIACILILPFAILAELIKKER